MKNQALFPGTFDPITLGHMNVVEKGLKLFDEVIIGIGRNVSKKFMFSQKERLEMLKAAFQNEPRIKVSLYQGLTVEFCREKNIRFILRGIRNTQDFEKEKAILEMNHRLVPSVETVLLTTEPQYSAISSTIVREIIKTGGDVSGFVPASVIKQIQSA